MKKGRRLITAGMLMAGNLLGGPEIVLANPANPKNPERTEMRNENTISAQEVFYRINEYTAGKVLENPGRGVEISDDENAIENILARVMISEEAPNLNKIHLAVLIALTVINRTNDPQHRFEQDIMSVVTSGKGFGLQADGRQYSTNRDPLDNDKKADWAKYRLLAKMIMNHKFDDYNFGQISFFHPRTQDALFEEGKVSKNSQTIHNEWLRNGLTEVRFPGVNNQYIRFYR